MTATPLMRSPARWLDLLLLLIAAAYAAQMATPLRINTDAVIFLGMAASHADGRGYTVAGAATHFPPGYPAVIELFEKAGIARSSTLVGFNVTCLLIAAAVGAWILRRWLALDATAARLAAVLMLLGWGTIKHATIPVSESTFAAASTLALACWVAAEGSRREAAIGWAALGLLMTGAAIGVRSIGVALVPAAGISIVIMLVRMREEAIGPDRAIASLGTVLRRNRARAVAVGFAVIVAVAAFGVAVSRTRYAHEGMNIARQCGGPVSLAKFVLMQRFDELGSVVLNVPSNALTGLAPLNLLAGPVMVSVLIAVLCGRWRSLRAPDVYLAGYAAILFVWPYNGDVRFWVPVSMFLFGLILRGLLDVQRRFSLGLPMRIAIGVWLLAFVLLGIAAFAFSTRISYAGRRFSEVYGSDEYRPTYRAASHSPLPIDPPKVSMSQLRLLARYGKPVFDDGWLESRSKN